MDRLLEMIKDDGIQDHQEELEALHYWFHFDRFNRKRVKPSALRLRMWKRRIPLGITDGRRPMKIKVQIVIESHGGETKAVENIACLERGMLRPAELGMNLDEARALLESVQHTIVEQQVAEYLEQQT